MGIRGDSVLVPWRPAFWIAAEVVGSFSSSGGGGGNTEGAPGRGAYRPAIFWLGVPKFGIQITRTLLKKSSISAESSRRDTSKSEVFSVLGALACTHDLLKVRPKCHYGVFFAQNFSLAKVITLANLTMHIYEVWPAVTPK